MLIRIQIRIQIQMSQLDSTARTDSLVLWDVSNEDTENLEMLSGRTCAGDTFAEAGERPKCSLKRDRCCVRRMVLCCVCREMTLPPACACEPEPAPAAACDRASAFGLWCSRLSVQLSSRSNVLLPQPLGPNRSTPRVEQLRL